VNNRSTIFNNLSTIV